MEIPDQAFASFGTPLHTLGFAFKVVHNFKSSKRKGAQEIRGNHEEPR